MFNINKFYEENKYSIFVVVLGATILLLGYFIYTIHTRFITPKKFFMQELKISTMVTAPESKYVPNKKYFEMFQTVNLPTSYDEFITFDEEVENEKVVIIDPNAKFKDESASFKQEYVVSDANQELYDLADKYYQVYWGSQRVSPIYPLAVSNVETGSRADHNITWSALFPSKYVDINNLYTMDVTTVLSSESIYKALSTESSTRDRGALQMSPTYGTGNDYFNSLMSGTEADKLSSVSSDHTTWINGASKQKGDRFYVPDVCLRLAAANTDAIERMTKNNYAPESDLQLVAMLAMYHHRSGVWSNDNHSKSIGEWKSGEHAFEYAKLASSDAVVSKLKEYALRNPDKFWIDADVVKTLFKDSTGREMTEFASKTLVCTYPIKVLYAYIKLCIMYSK